MVKLDKVDMQILKLLQEDGRLNNAEIAKRVFLSPPACWKRLRKVRISGEILLG
jgi:Lrp/AsnC family transcriptional regulator, leucine-responsive regulatory protein